MGRITVTIEDAMRRELESEARARGVTPSDVVREAIAAHLRGRTGRTTALELARHLGVIGCASGLPPDLSTNREHFEGFGRG